MDAVSWKRFAAARDEYRLYTETLAAALPGLRSAQERLVEEREAAGFAIETPVVYNGALDDLGPADEVRLILVADNPGRREQAAANRRYLVGPSGKLADGFFRSRAELGIDFRKDVLILNKTPIHTPRTGELRELGRLGGTEVARAIESSQLRMVQLIRSFHEAVRTPSGPPVPLWIIGYSELGRGKLFEPFSRALTEAYRDDYEFRASVLLFRHFSMNQFSVDIRKRTLVGEPVGAALARIGAEYRERVLGW
ncbi:MAG: hypothetical protein A2Z99_07685 [Treponema sp. GWB1_62_6]|nr:MAG: hypothetical protein A2Y36_10480 [Treponema sp. GWA1_62_8]OHE67786.1 MAG: hypothetical protein A2Z99_07685 [Treponema sp. GWB1_62_6]OHE68678.1 MAG: hypothetical protein A2001_05760 [Treponema sp. GWC1_61_84]OHE70421.1 MAG: hypothetical protein A2413_15390 [Treponema sp. RIFOXYC1_FULL_61_9]HCM26560.1 hypothetical protein [Treponema sp.]